MGASPWMFFHRDCNQVIGEVSQLLTRSNLTVIESFDLQAARAHHNSCDCPQHGTEQCTCQLAILLVYGDDNVPVSLMIDGNNERAELSIIETPGQTIAPDIKGKITATLRANDFAFADEEIKYDASG